MRGGGGGVYFFGEGQFILYSFSHFEMQDLKIYKTFHPWHPIFQHSHFQI